MSMRVVIKCSDMPEKIQLEAISLAVQAYYNNPITNEDTEKDADCYREIAAEIKKEFDSKYKPCWHCIVGENFGSFITHESKTFLFFEIDTKSILLFKSA